MESGEQEMTVAELREKLAAFPDDMPCVVWTPEQVAPVECVEVVRDRERFVLWIGERDEA